MKWTYLLCEELGRYEASLDFQEALNQADVVGEAKNIYSIDVLRSRDDGCYDRLFIVYEYFGKPSSSYLQEICGLDEYGWLIDVQYAINRNESCLIPTMVDGGYCNLFDLTEFVSVDEEYITGTNQYILGEEDDMIKTRIMKLANFLAESVPFFAKKIAKEFFE